MVKGSNKKADKSIPMMFQELEDIQQKLMINPLNKVFWTQEKLIKEYIEKYALEYELYLGQRSYQIRFTQ